MDVKKLRADFPILQKENPIIYFDNACMTMKPVQVIEAMNRYYYEFPSCAGRSVHKLAASVTEAVEEARKKMQQYINAKVPEEIVFTRNTSEGLNLVSRCLGLKERDVVITTDREHNSNSSPWHTLRERVGGIEHKIVPSNEDNTFNLEIYENMLSGNVKLVSMVHTSNLDGYTTPAREIIKVAHDYGASVMLDAAQSAPHKPIDVQKLDVDFLAFSVHKMCGPSGMGILYGKYDLLEKLDTFLVGGDTVKKTTYDKSIFLPPPDKFEAGLQNYAGMIGAAAAAKYINTIGRENIVEHEYRLNKIITDGIKNFDGLNIIGPQDPRLRSGIVSFTVDRFNPHDIAMIMDEVANVAIRSGQHCVHSWFNSRGINGSARASLYLYNTKDEANIFIENLEKILHI